MASYDYNIAKDVLSDNDKNRLVCLWLNRTPDGQVRLFAPLVLSTFRAVLTRIGRLGQGVCRFRLCLCQFHEGLDG